MNRMVLSYCIVTQIGLERDDNFDGHIWAYTDDFIVSR